MECMKDRVAKLNKEILYTKDDMYQDRNKDKAKLHIPMVTPTKASFAKTNPTALENSNG